MNKAEKSLRWVVNQIPDFKPTTNEEKMLIAIKLYSEAGAEEIRRLEVENAKLKEMLSRVKSGRVSNLKSENAALRKRLEKAVLNRCIYYLASIWNDATMTRRKEVRCRTVDYICDKFVQCNGLVLNWDEIYFTSEAAEARLAELKGETK